MHNNAKNDLEATALQEVGKLELIVAEVRKLGATNVAGRSEPDWWPERCVAAQRRQRPCSETAEQQRARPGG